MCKRVLLCSVKQCNFIKNFLFLFVFIVIIIDREVIEYSLSKLLERLQINHQEVRFTSDLLKITFLLTGRITRLSFFHFSPASLLTCVFCWAATTAKKYVGWVQRGLWNWSRSIALSRMWFCMSTGRYLCVLFCKNKFKNLMSSLCNRTTQCHFSGSTVKHGRYSWMHHKLHLQNSPGPSQTKKPWSSSSIAPHVLGAYSSQDIPFDFFFQLPTGLRDIYACVHGLFVARPGSVTGWWSSIRHGKISERRENSSRQQGGRLVWRISSGLQERGVVWETVFFIMVFYIWINLRALVR